MTLYLKTNGLYVKTGLTDTAAVSIDKNGVNANLLALKIKEQIINSVDIKENDDSEENKQIPTTAKVIELIGSHDDAHTHNSFDNSLTIISPDPQLSLQYPSAPSTLLASDPQGNFNIETSNSKSTVITSTLDSSSKTTGALLVGGGIGVAQKITCNYAEASSHVSNSQGSTGQFQIVDIPNAKFCKIYLEEYAPPALTQKMHLSSSDGVVVDNILELSSLKLGTTVSLIDTDVTLASNSDSRLPTQKAVKTYITTNIPITYVGGIMETGTTLKFNSGNLNLGNVPISAFSIDGTMSSNSDTKIPTEKAIVTYANSLHYTDYNRYESGLHLTAAIGWSNFQVTAGTWIYHRDDGVKQSITYSGSPVTIDPGIALLAANTHIYISNNGFLAYSYDSYLDVTKMTSNYIYIGTLLHGRDGGGSFVIFGVASYAVFPKKYAISSSLGPMIEELYPMLRTFPTVSDAGNNDLSINISSFQVAKPWLAIKGGSYTSAVSVGPYSRPLLFGAYRPSAGAPLTTIPGTYVFTKVVIPAIGYGSTSALGVSRYAAYTLLFEGITGSFYYIIPNRDYGTAAEAGTSVRNLVFLPEMRATNIIAWVIFQGGDTNLTAATFLRGIKLNYSCF